MASGVAVNVIMGYSDALDQMAPPHYYRFLDCGVRIGLGNGSDHPARVAGVCRVYVKSGPALDYSRWCDELASGMLYELFQLPDITEAFCAVTIARTFPNPLLREVMRTTLGITSMIFVILLGASVFSLVFRGLGGENLVHDALASLPGGVVMAVFAVMVVIFVLGFFLDTFEIIFIVVPITAPALIKLGVDPIWLGVMIGMNLQTSFLTPPFGFALFYLRGVASTLVRTADIYRGVVPFVVLQLIGVTLVALAPGMATSLPARLYAEESPATDVRAPTGTTGAPSGSPVADDFSDLLEEPVPGRNPPYLDDFEALVTE
jgi:hypothetical protein